MWTKFVDKELKKTTVYDCSVIELPKIHNRAGNITPINGKENLPFDINIMIKLLDLQKINNQYANEL